MLTVTRKRYRSTVCEIESFPVLNGSARSNAGVVTGTLMEFPGFENREVLRNAVVTSHPDSSNGWE